MKNKILFLFILFTSAVYSQKEKTLFWEISGNGLAKKSYLYGTMHINEKISYHLSDSFYKNLLDADIVANESDPETWSDLKILTSPSSFNNSFKFYTNFYKRPAKRESIATVFVNDNSYFNNMMSFDDGNRADYQENSVLDMFIYHTGRKYNKKVLGLEIARESLIPLMNISADDAIVKEENRAALFKFMKNKGPEEIMNQYYREKDIVMLDSLYKLMFSKKAQNALITNRNHIMTKSIDSLAKKGSLFAAVGAAHLAGKEGILELLIKKGYTVKPIFDEMTESGQAKKKTIEEYFPNPNFSVARTKDGMIAIPLYKTATEKDFHIGSADFTNGGIINIKRLPLNYFVKKENATYNPKSLDSLFFENIPGNIIEKKFFETDSYSGYDIKSKTKAGNSQHYRFYITPIEIIAISMIGNGNYVRQYENEVFNNIKIKGFSNNWEKTQPENGGFSVETPAFKTADGLGVDNNNVEIQAYDSYEKSYYFLTKRVLNDSKEILGSEEEQQQIHNEFYLQYDSYASNVKYNAETFSLDSNSKIGEKDIKLKSFIHGSDYYLLGTVNASEKNALRFFNSFKQEPYRYDSNVKTFQDTVAKFKVEIPEKGNEKILWATPAKSENTKNTFVSKNNQYSFQTLSGKTVDLEYFIYPKYYNQTSLDSIKKNLESHLLKVSKQEDGIEYHDDDYYTESPLFNYDFLSKRGVQKTKWTQLTTDKKDSYEFVSKTESYDKENNVYTVDAVVSKPNSTSALKQKIVHTGDSYYLLSALIDKNSENEDQFIQKTFDSFVLLDKKSISDKDKLDLFIEDAKSDKDTIRYSALTSVEQLEITKKDFDKITHFLSSFKFKNSENSAIKSLLEKIGYINDDRVIPYLESYYKKESDKTTIQISILKALANQKSKAGYRKIIELLEYDLPLSNNQYQISSLFSYFEKDIENSKELYPKIFQFYTVKEYKEPVLEFCNLLFDKEVSQIKKINSHKKALIADAKMEYKRLLSTKQNYSEDEDEDFENSFDAMQTSELTNYLVLLSNFKEDKNIEELFSKSDKLDISHINNEILRIKVVNNKLTDSEEKEALANPEKRFLMMQLLLNKNPKREFKDIPDEEIALSALMVIRNFTKKDSLKLITVKEFKKNHKDISAYFFKSEKANELTQLSEPIMHGIYFIKENNNLNLQAYYATQTVLDEETPEESQIELIIDSIIKESNPRASFEKEKEGTDNMMFNFLGT